jgi:hypothetical protein
MPTVSVSLKIDRDEDGEETGVVGVRITHRKDDDTFVEVELYHTSIYFEGYTFEQAVAAIEAAKGLFDSDAASAPFTGDLSRHMEVGPNTPRIICGLFILAGTEVANIGGMRTICDGHYLIRDDRILRCETPDRPSSWWSAPGVTGHRAGLSKH